MDAELVRRGITESRTRARDAVLEGRVLVSGAVASKPERMVAAAEPIELIGPASRFVSRGGEKLDAALVAFRIDVAGRGCLDVGASTGGFTDCLLQRGARSVVALDVGRGQLAWSLRQDERVRVLERTDVREARADVVGTVQLTVVDVSFISLRTVMEPIVRLAGSGPILALVKPQFEVGKGRVPRGGVVRDPSLHRDALRRVADAAIQAGLDVRGATPSALPGTTGNQEYFLLLGSER